MNKVFRSILQTRPESLPRPMFVHLYRNEYQSHVNPQEAGTVLSKFLGWGLSHLEPKKAVAFLSYMAQPGVVGVRFCLCSFVSAVAPVVCAAV